MTVSVIICSYNTRKLTIECICSLAKHCAMTQHEIIVVDNASTDGSADAIEKECPYARVIRSPRNLGFGKANNLGMQHAAGRYFFLLNPDTVVLNDALQMLVDFADKCGPAELGCVGTQLLDPEGHSTLSHGSFHRVGQDLRHRWRHLLGEMARTLGLRNPCPRPQISNAPAPRSSPFEVEVVSGADMFFPREVFEQFDGFDPEFFMYSEEVEWQYRMRQSGRKNFILPGPRITHFEGASSKDSNHKRIMMIVSKLIFFRKHSSRLGYLVFKAGFLFSLLAEFAIDLIRRRYTGTENITLLRKFLREEY